MNSKNILISVLFGLIGGALSSFGIFYFTSDNNSGFETHDADGLPNRIPANLASLNSAGLDSINSSFVLASAVSTSSVVYIKSQSQQGLTWNDWFFGDRYGQRQAISSGSGVIYTKDGYIITNNHVIEGAEQIQVIINRKPYDAEIVGTDPSTDLAVLKVNGKEDFDAVSIGSSRNLDIGEWVLAVGNPFNLQSTVTAGIVSAKGRDIGIVKERFPLESFIQTDAAINPGNSGGALVNLKGELVGINTAIMSKTGYYTGYGFAVPSDIVVKVANDLIKYKKVQKAFIGADIDDVDYETALEINARNVEGVVVKYILEDGAADEGGLEKGDVIVSIDGQKVRNKSDFDEELSIRNPGDKIKVKIKRGDKELNKTIELKNEEGTTDILIRKVVVSDKLGADFEAVPKVERELYKIDNGVKISAVRSGLISRMGIQEGFIITGINGREVEEPKDAIDMLENARGRVVIEGVNKNGGKGFYSFFF